MHEHMTAADYQSAARCPGTINRYESRLRRYHAWCRAQDVQPFPTTPEQTCRFLADLARTCTLTTLVVTRSALAYGAHQRGEQFDGSHYAIVDLLRGVRRTSNRQPKQAAAIMLEDVRALLATCADDARGQRDRAAILLGFAGAFRRSEIVAMNVEHIGWTHDGITVAVAGKARPIATAIPIPRGANLETCPVLALEAWLTRAKIKTGAIFRAIDRNGETRSIRTSDRSIQRIIQTRAAQAGIVGSELHPITSHGLRAGFITSAYRAGASDVEIMEHVRHKSPEIMRGYVRRERLGTGSLAGKVGL